MTNPRLFSSPILLQRQDSIALIYLDLNTSVNIPCIQLTHTQIVQGVPSFRMQAYDEDQLDAFIHGFLFRSCGRKQLWFEYSRILHSAFLFAKSIPILFGAATEEEMEYTTNLSISHTKALPNKQKSP